MNWNHELQDCSTQDGVLEIVNEFLAGQDPKFWSVLTPAARPETMTSPAEIHRWHHALVQELRGAKRPPFELQELCVLFLRASVRLHQIELHERGRSRLPSNDELGCASRRRYPRRI